MRILYLATRSPFPPRDGGALLMAATIHGLEARGHDVEIVTPPGVRRSLPEAFVRGLVSGRPLSVERHHHPVVTSAVADLISRQKFDVVHVEQPQGMRHAHPAFERGLPVVLRAQNVESELWRMLAEARPARRVVARREAQRLAAWESECVSRARITLALTTEDAGRLRSLAPSSRVEVLRMPMAAQLPPGDGRLPGNPAVVLLASGGWFPNRDGVTWFLREIWPSVSSRLPQARLHVFGRTSEPVGTGIIAHPAPEDSREAFVAGSILAVPLRIASGARVRILEAWARGVPVVGTPQAVAGLDAAPGEAALVASTAEQFAAAFESLAGAPAHGESLIAAGRDALRRWHDPEQIAATLESFYEELSVSAGRTD